MRIREFKRPIKKFKPFIVKVDLSVSGYSIPASNNMVLPFYLTSSDVITVDWGDGNLETFSNVSGLEHIYSTTGIYTVKIIAINGMPRVEISSDYTSYKIISIEQWGNNKFRWGWNSYNFSSWGIISINDGVYPPGFGFSGTFQNCKELTYVEPFINVNGATDFSFCFAGCTALTSFPTMNFLSGIDFSGLFNGCTGLVTLGNLEFPNGKIFNEAFRGLTITSFPEIYVPLGESFTNAWRDCNKLQSFPELDLPSAISLRAAWAYAFDPLYNYKFPSLNVPNIKDLTQAWSYSKITEISDFNFGEANCSQAFDGSEITIFRSSQDLSGVTDMSFMFRGCYSLHTVEEFTMNTSSPVNMMWTFFDCAALTSFAPIDTSAVNNFDMTWGRCTQLTTFPLISLEGADTLAGTWALCYNLASVPDFDISTIKHFTGSSVGGSWEWGVFYDTAISEIPNCDWSGVITLDYVFRGCQNITTVDPVRFNTTSAATSFASTFRSCTGLLSVGLIDTSEARDMSDFLSYTENLVSLAALDTSKCENFENFLYRSGLINYPALNTSSGVNFWGTLGYSKFTELPPWDFSNGTDFTNFCFRSELKGLGNPNFNSAIRMRDAFAFCTGLNGKDFPTQGFPNATDLNGSYGMLHGSKITTQSATDLLIEIAEKNLNTGVVLNLGNANWFISQGQAAYDALINRGWTIYHGGGI